MSHQWLRCRGYTLRSGAVEDWVERLHVNYLRDLTHRLRAGASQRGVARDLGLARLTVQKYARWAAEAGYLDAEAPLPEAAELAARLGSAPEPPRAPSGVVPHRAVVEELRGDRVEIMTIFDRLQERGYGGSYSSVRRFVRQLEPREPEAVARVHTAPGEEAQVDSGTAGKQVDPRSGRPRPAWVFVMTLGFSRHQYAELVFGQQVATSVGPHRRAFEWFGGQFRGILECLGQVPTRSLRATRRYILGAVFVYQFTLLYRAETGGGLRVGLKPLLRAT